MPVKTNKKFFASVALMFFLAMPASTNYKLKDYGFGTGGTGDSSSANYSLEAITGEVSEDQLTGTNYKAGPGLIFMGQANVPIAPTFDNPANYYNKLRLIINESGNPSDTIFAVAISTDNFVSDTRYVQNDNTIGSTLGSEDYQTYANWGGASGEYIIGLTADTTYYVKVKAMQGKFSETGYGPVDSAVTVNPTLSFGININSIDFGDLVPGSVNSSPQNVIVSFATNGENGGKIYVYGSNEGLYSAVANYKIDAVSDNLAALSQGFGAQGVSATQTSGGPLTIAALYNHQGDDIVGTTDQIIRDIFNTAGPIIGGSGTFLLKAKSSLVTPSASDYSELLTVIASGNF